MTDYDQFLTAMGWQHKPGAVEVGEPRAWDRPAIDGLPQLSALLDSATVTPLFMSGAEHLLLAFGPADARRGWLTLPALTPEQADSAPVHVVHREVLTRFGGIGDTFGFDEGHWSSNHQDILARASAGARFAESIDAYRWIWEDDGLEVPIRPEDYYGIAQEANGNLTLAHRENGSVILFAPDHAYDDVTELDGCPPQSLYTIDGMPDLTSWIEGNAARWLAG